MNPSHKLQMVPIKPHRSMYFILGMFALLLTLYNTTQNEIRALGTFSSTRKTTIAVEQPENIIVQRTPTTTTRTTKGTGPTNTTFLLNKSSLHLNHSKLTDANSITRPRAFPQWGKEGIDIGALLEFIFHSSLYAVEPQQRAAQQQRHQQDNAQYYRPTKDHANDVGYWFPEVLYILDADGLWCSRRHRDILTKVGRATVRQKLVPVEDLILAAVKRLGSMSNEETTVPLLRLANAIPLGIPFLAFYGDFTGCNHFNWQNNDDSLTTTPALSIPLFTTAAAVSCDYAIPIPNYQTIHDASTISEDLFLLWKERYPSESKIPQVVWRGSLTGNVLLNDTHKSLRWAVVEKFHNHSSGLFNVGTTRLPKRHEQHLDLSAVGGIVEGLVMEDFQKYAAILDMDGNSWSSRFGKLLCFNSVVLKMKPEYVDYFFFDLVPWVHYIPVDDLDDLLDKAQYALDPNHSETVEQIVANANGWCRNRMVLDRIVEDMLHILERYVKLLDTGSGPQWQQAILWARAKELIQQPVHPLAMDLLLPTSSLLESAG